MEWEVFVWKKPKFLIKSETKLQSVYDFLKIQLWNFYSFFRVNSEMFTEYFLNHMQVQSASKTTHCFDFYFYPRP